MVAYILWWLIGLYIWVLLARVILTWIPMFAPTWTPRGFVLVIVEFIYTLTDPPVKALGRFIKPVRIGNASLDLSVLVLFIGLQILQSFVGLIPF
ncbi:YggT family protein [Tessaracoccus sp. Z1128]